MLSSRTKIILSSVILLIYGDNCFANAGTFSGYGHTVELSSTNSIQMVSEEVTIIPYLMEKLPNNDPYSAAIGKIEYDCIFHLKNLEDEEQTIQVGFPLNSDSIERGLYKEKEPYEVVSEYDFVAQVEDQKYKVRYVAGDRKNNLRHLFLWDMDFEPGESKMLHVSYSMPASFGLDSTDMSMGLPDYEKEMFNGLGFCGSEGFGYVTETGKSWAGTIEKATFRVYLEEVEKSILNRPFMKSKKGPRNPVTRKEEPSIPSSPVVFRYIEPDDWVKDDEGFFTLELENYEPKQNFLFGYSFLFSFQRTLGETCQIIPALLMKNFWTGEDYWDYVDILKEYNGIKTGNKRIQPFLKNQRWYGKEKIQYVPHKVIWTLEIIGWALICGLGVVCILVGVLFFWLVKIIYKNKTSAECTYRQDNLSANPEASEKSKDH